MRIKTALSIICLLSLLLGSFLGFAQQKPYRLDGIVVTANREAMPLLEAPANVSQKVIEESKNIAE